MVVAPRWSQEARWLQDGPKRTQDGPKMTQDGRRRPKMGSEWVQMRGVLRTNGPGKVWICSSMLCALAFGLVFCFEVTGATYVFRRRRRRGGRGALPAPRGGPSGPFGGFWGNAKFARVQRKIIPAFQNGSQLSTGPNMAKHEGCGTMT